MSDHLDDARRALSDRFGFADFQPYQSEAIEAVLQGRDTLLVLPTGGGKSLAYQLPALLLDGLTLVISPLIALMQDQVDALRRKSIRADFINSTLSARQREDRLQAAADGKLDLLFVTPERFRSPTFLDYLPRLNVTRLAVDEAHCVSEWGHDFRPDYWRLGQYRRELLGSPPTLAVTATATPKVASEIATQLELSDPLVLRAGIDRPELFLACTPVETPEDKLPILADRIARIDGPGIVYSTLIRDLEHLRDELRRRGIRALVYHGKLGPEERRRMQHRFMESEREVVLATNAFGMGVDKADIRFVLHAQVPRTLSAWTQEVGRAGRDGRPSLCECLVNPEDLAIQQNFVNWANPDRAYLVGVYEVLRGWGERLATKDVDDLRDELLVKQRGDNRVHLCLKWLEVLGVTRGSFEAHDLELARELDPDELPEFVGTPEKRTHDLTELLELWRFVGQHEQCRRVALATYFGLPAPPSECGACDVCRDADDWLAESGLPGRVESSAQAPEPPTRGDDDSPFRVGDWVRVEGRHLGQVVRTEGRGDRIRLVVESVGDMRRRTVDPRRKKVERLDD